MAVLGEGGRLLAETRVRTGVTGFGFSDAGLSGIEFAGFGLSGFGEEVLGVRTGGITSSYRDMCERSRPPGPGGDGALRRRLGVVRHDEGGVDLRTGAEAGAGACSARRGVGTAIRWMAEGVSGERRRRDAPPPVGVRLQAIRGSKPASRQLRRSSVSTTIVDVSPFSTNGALVLSNVRGVDRGRFYRQIIGYTCGIVGFGPMVAWGALVLPWS
ncbi:hypothetical protein ACWEJP_04175 [Streptomyces sp. NPDC004749]